MSISRQTAVRAGLHFRFYVFREHLFGKGQRFAHTPECAELNEYYSAAVPKELRDVFVNPSYTLEDLAKTYRDAREGGTATETRLNTELHKALYGLDERVYHWFRLGQVAIAAFECAAARSPQLQEGVQALMMIAAACGLEDEDKHRLAFLFSQLKLHFAEPGKNPFAMTGAVFSGLSDIAGRYDRRQDAASKGGPLMKLLSLVLLMLLGFGGFYFLPTTEKAAMWLAFVVVAIPPVLAVLFESSKLSGANIVELYRLGLRGIPVLGKLAGK